VDSLVCWWRLQLGTFIADPKISRTLNAYSSTTKIKVNKRSVEVVEKRNN